MGRQKAGGNGQLPKHALHGPYLKVSIRYRFTVLLPRTITNDRPTMPEPSHQSHPHTTVSPSTPFSTGQGFPISMWLHIAVRRDGFDTTSRPWRGFRVRCMTGGRPGLSRCMCWTAGHSQGTSLWFIHTGTGTSTYTPDTVNNELNVVMQFHGDFIPALQNEPARDPGRKYGTGRCCCGTIAFSWEPHQGPI